MHIKKLLVLLALSLLPIAAFSGYVQPAPVFIDVVPGVSGYANGDLVSARNSDNEFEFIGCRINTYEDGLGGTFTNGLCQVGLEETVSYRCFTTNPVLLEAINGLSDSSWVGFRWVDDGTGNLTCTGVSKSTQSFYLQNISDSKKKGKK